MKTRKKNDVEVEALPPEQIDPNRKRMVMCFMTVVGCIAVMIVFSMISSIFSARYTNTKNEFSMLENQAELYKDGERKVKTVVKESDKVKLSTDQWAADDKYMLSWVNNMFSFRGLDDYEEKRQEYIDVLGEDNAFLNYAMPAIEFEGYIYSDETDVNKDVSGDHSSSITRFSSSLIYADDDKRTYMATIVLDDTRLDDDVLVDMRADAVSTNRTVVFIYTLSGDDEISNLSAADIGAVAKGKAGYNAYLF